MNKFNVGDIVRTCSKIIEHDYLPYENISDWRIREVINKETEDGKYVEYLIEHILSNNLRKIINQNVLLHDMEQVEGRELTKY